MARQCGKMDFVQFAVAVLLGLGLIGVWSTQTHAQSCPLQNRYDQCVFLTTHNAYANFADGWLVHAQQSYMNVKQQLEAGVRALMLDIYKFSDLTHDEDIYLCHNSCALSILLRGLAPIPLRKLRDTLEEIKEFLDAHPQEVVTIMFESSIAGDEARLKQAFMDSGTLDYLFLADQPNKGSTGDTWEVNVKDTSGTTIGHAWPTVQWIVDNGKRLVVFSSEGGTGALFRLPYLWDYTIENVFSDESLDEAQWCNERGQSQARSATPEIRTLYVMNHFPSACCPLSPESGFGLSIGLICVANPVFCVIPAFGIPIGLGVVAGVVAWPIHYGTMVNDADNIRNHVNSCRPARTGLPTFPNFLAVDFFEIGEHGGPQQIISELRNGAPLAPTLVEPADATPLNNPTPRFGWNAATDPEGNPLTYHLEVAVDQAFSGLVIDVSGLSATSFTPGTALMDDVYYWRVQACDSVVGCGPFSAILLLQIDTVPPTVTLVAPNGGEIIPAAGPSFFDITWHCADNGEGSDLPATPIDLRYSLDDGATFPHVIATDQENDTVFPGWNTPDVDEGGVQVQIRCTDRAGNIGVDTSDASFTIMQGQVFLDSAHQVLIPNPTNGNFAMTTPDSTPICSGVGTVERPSGVILVPSVNCTEDPRDKLHVLINKQGGPALVTLILLGQGTQKFTFYPQ